MKINLRKIKSNRGIALILTVIIFAVAAVMFSTYLILAASEYNTVGRSQKWNDALTVSEAGVEEGLALINKYAYTGTSITNWSATAPQDGWTLVSTTPVGQGTYEAYSKSLTLPNSMGAYTVWVTNVFTNFSYGTVYGSPTILSVGTVTPGSGPTISRSVFVQTAGTVQSGGGVVAQDGVSESGTVAIDSWDSSTNLHSIWQTNTVFRRNYFNPGGTQYGIWSNSLSFISNSYPSRTADVHVFTQSNSVTVGGNVTICGYIQTGPNGTASLHGGGTVGDLPWCYGPSGNGSGASSGLQTGHWQEDANMNFYSYPLPTPVDPTNGWMNWSNVVLATSLPVTNVIRIGGMWTNNAGAWSCVGGYLVTNSSSGFTIAGTTYNYIITNRLQNTNWVYYSMDSLGHGQNLFIDAQYVVLYLTNGLSYKASDTLSINTNADVQIWSGGGISTTAQSTINNYGNYTHAFSIFDIAGNPISVSLHGQSQVNGYYYLPSSSLSFSGGGDVCGAIVCYSISVGGGTDIHFDESLKIAESPDQFIPSTWTEIAPN